MFNEEPALASLPFLERIMHQSHTLELEILVENGHSRDDALNLAVERLIPQALKKRSGILVMQHSATAYGVKIDSSVPCGQIHEKRS